MLKKEIIKHIFIFIVLFTIAPSLISAAPNNTDQIIVPTLPELQFEYENPLQVNSFTELIKNFLAKLQAIIAWLAIIMIVIGGIIYITSAGKTSQIELGKKIITFALIGFAIAVAAPSILKELVDLARSGQGATSSQFIDQATRIKVILLKILQFTISLIGVIAIIGFTVSGILFVTSAGDSNRATKARYGLIYSLIGVAVAGATLILIKQILILLGMQIN
jgi:type II secretory pathway component PulF